MFSLAANISTIILLISTQISSISTGKEGDVVGVEEDGQKKSSRYLLYDINPGEGFNLRRDVYMRVANLVKVLNEAEPWTLVLPPWGPLAHWRSEGIQRTRLPWSTLFDVDSLRRHVPVIEYDEYIKETGGAFIDEVYYLQSYKEGWTDGKWEERMDIRECNGPTGYYKEQDGLWRGWFWDYQETKAQKFECLSIQMEATHVKPFLIQNTTARSVCLLRAESLIHGMLSEWSGEFWTARRSLRFAKHLQEIGDVFRKTYLDSDDERDKTVLDEDWTKMKKQHGDALGGPYLGVHLRRGDFLYAHPDEVPSIDETANQIKDKLNELKLKTVFIGTDMSQEEWKQLKKKLKEYKVTRFEPRKETLEKYKDAGVAIIDQWILAHSRYFMGTSVSTFTFRIHEEREIMGFKSEMTFNRICHEKNKKCEQPNKWTVVYKSQWDHDEL